MITAHRIGDTQSSQGKEKWQAVDAASQELLEGVFTTATEAEANLAMQKAAEAFTTYRALDPVARAAFLRSIADGIEALGDTLVKRMMQESALTEQRVRGERVRTTGQLRMFADLITEGSWVDAIIDTPDPDRNPPKPGLRRMLHPIGPVVVFTASNFPLAYSTAGGDTASALAAGCPVVVKAHEAHPGTNALVADAIVRAAEKTGMPDGVFSTVYAQGFETGQYLVRHPMTAAVGFTGSRTGGRALFDIAASRGQPIPVFAEMSSVNPIFLLPGALDSDAQAYAKQIAASVNTGAGQFCTCPGLIIALDNPNTERFTDLLNVEFEQYQPVAMLHAGIYRNYAEGKARMLDVPGVQTLFDHEGGSGTNTCSHPAVAAVGAAQFLSDPELHREVFGPFTMMVRCRDMGEMQEVARQIEGQLTATVCGKEDEIALHADLTDILREKAGRLIFNGVPTGVEVSPGMVHGGPYPATTDSRFTAVGTAAIRRWVRPVTYQNWPEALLPEVLRDANPKGIWRTVDAKLTKEGVQ